MAKKVNAKLYDIIPSQDTMCYMLKYSIHKQVTNVPMSLAVTHELNFDKMQKALDIEIQRNDCMRLRFVKENKKVMQYFIEPYSYGSVPIHKFSSIREQEEFFNAEASKPVRFLKGETFRVHFFIDSTGKYGVYINAAHLIMDAMAVSVFFKDLFEVYNSLMTGSEMPQPLSSFEEYLAKEYAYLNNERRYNSDKQFALDLIKTLGPPLYCGVHGPALLDKKREKDPELRVPALFDPIHDKALQKKLSMSEEETTLLLAYCEKTGIAPELMLETGYKLYASAINHRADDTTMMVLCSRRPAKKEQNMGGCLAQPLRMRTKTTEDMTFKQLLEVSAKQRALMFMHSNFPYMDGLALEREAFNLSAAQGTSFMMYTWLPLEKMSQIFGEDADFRGYEMDRYILPLYTFSFRSMDKKRIEFYYMYRTNLLSEQNILSLHKKSLKAIFAGIDNPEITIAELFDMIIAE